MTDSADDAVPASSPKDRNKGSVTIKKYANRRLYNTATSTYVTLEDLTVMVKKGIEFNVYDAKTGEDLTRSVLTQIIVEEEGKGGESLLPINFLRQMIGFYGNNMQWLVPRYLDHTIRTLTENQDKFSSYMQNVHSAFGGIIPFQSLEEVGRQNLALFEKMMGPLGEGVRQAQQMVQTTAEQQMKSLQNQLMSVQRQLAEMSRNSGSKSE